MTALIIKIEDIDNINSLLACLGLGVLHAIRNGILPPTYGVWTLGMPRVIEPLEQTPSISEKILAVFQQFDELGAIKELIPGEYDLIINGLIKDLESELSKFRNQLWEIELTGKE